MAIGTQPDVKATKSAWVNLGPNKLVQWKGGANALVHISASAPSLASSAGAMLSSEVRFILSTEAANVYVRGLDGDADLAVMEVTP